ncbi:hypothetical protein PVAND_005025 [Polypedilum vanderplanki]|uniref:Uncharacterized protein n=1 Tax=Polypedilum vanderplanki TaxID=319348 RepID=A0A9J6BZT5_POLVA|nr:hypothetical protein PVAND_005025 [Polypedilum vanderplanki]
MDQEELFNLAEKKLSKFVNCFEKSNTFDYDSLQKFKNLIECIPMVDETMEYQQMIGEVEDIIYYGSHGGRNYLRDKKKISTIIELFMVIKYECLKPEERDNTKSEKIFLTICAFAFTMLMFAP